MSDDSKPLTMDVPTAGRRYYGLGRQASYEAAKRGDIPVIRVGKASARPDCRNGSQARIGGTVMKNWQQIGDVARDITERLEPRVVKVTVCHAGQESRVLKVPVTIIEQEPLILKIEVERRTP